MTRTNAQRLATMRDARKGKAGTAWHEGSARQGRLGAARLGAARRGKAGDAWHGWAGDQI